MYRRKHSTSAVERGRVAIVTGGANGIGKAICEALAEGGDKVVVVDLAEEEGTEVARSVGGCFIKTDLTVPGDCKRVVEKTIKEYGKVSILVNNAGFQYTSPIQDFPEEMWDKMMAVMLDAPFRMTKYVWNSMAAAKWGRIVNLASIIGLKAQPLKSAYVSAKHGIIGLTLETAIEGGPFGITVNAICPAPVNTELVAVQLDGLAKARKVNRDRVVSDVMLERAVVKRLVEPREVASLVKYLCSEEASAISGAALTIDLGWTAWA